VSRIRPAFYTFTSEEATILTDNRGHKIEVSKISVQNKSDLFLHIKSEQKALKEKSMDAKITDRFEERINYLNKGLIIPGRTKRSLKYMKL